MESKPEVFRDFNDWNKAVKEEDLERITKRENIIMAYAENGRLIGQWHKKKFGSAFSIGYVWRKK